jgi:hypothetical protein
MTTDDVNILIPCAIRYALGRMSYITGMISYIAINNIKKLHQNMRESIIKEITYAIDMNIAGADIDVYEWRKLLNALENADDL